MGSLSIAYLLGPICRQMEICDAFSLKRHRVWTHVNNDLGPGIALTLHCKSAEDDLGEHVLQYHDQGFQFTFRPNVWGVTLFYCSFSWQGGPIHWFNIYDDNRDDGKSKVFDVRPNGPCEVHDFPPEVCYVWNPPSNV
ncbi:S-protein homolog 4-like [Tripterygium wilfordii]|uniref:S-protein homolog 4-like n=1 Tax=Tripterygium wilfordii TaxID=458696 RepID=UPI0018F7F30F|nr:S-protein homolog 4-like [Tripterygium wilfordii]